MNKRIDFKSILEERVVSLQSIFTLYDRVSRLKELAQTYFDWRYKRTPTKLYVLQCMDSRHLDMFTVKVLADNIIRELNLDKYFRTTPSFKTLKHLFEIAEPINPVDSFKLPYSEEELEIYEIPPLNVPIAFRKYSITGFSECREEYVIPRIENIGNEAFLPRNAARIVSSIRQSIRSVVNLLSNLGVPRPVIGYVLQYMKQGYIVEASNRVGVSVGRTSTSIASWTGEINVLFGEIEKELRERRSDWMGTVEYYTIIPRSPVAIIVYSSTRETPREIHKIRKVHILSSSITGEIYI